MLKKRSIYESFRDYKNSVFIRNYGATKKKYFFSFLAIFDKNTGHRVTKFYPVSCINITYNFYFMIFFSNWKKYFEFIYIHDFELINHRKRDRVVGRVVDSKIMNPGSRPTANNFFSGFFTFRICGRQSFLFFAKKTPHLRKAEAFFAKKSSAFC